MSDQDEKTIPQQLEELLADPEVAQFLMTLTPSADKILATRENGQALIRLAYQINFIGEQRCEMAQNACRRHKYPRHGFVCEICGHDIE